MLMSAAKVAMLLFGCCAVGCRPPLESPPNVPDPTPVPIAAASDPSVVAGPVVEGHVAPTPVDAEAATSFDVSSGGLHITYTTSGADGQPQLTYVNDTQSLTFAGPQIRTVAATDVGTLVSVSIWRTVDAGSTSFTLLVPPVILPSPDATVEVTLLGITTTHRFGVDHQMNRGQLAGYSQVTLTGTARR